MDGVVRIGDHMIDLDEDYESDQLRDDEAENRAPEPPEDLPPTPPGMPAEDSEKA